MRLTIIVFLLFILIGCLSTNKETPQEGLQAIRTLHASANYETLIRERYGEIGKLKGEEDILKLIEWMEKRYSTGDNQEQMLTTLDEALRSKPVIFLNSVPQEFETDTLATFSTSQGPLKVYLMKSGLWGFHL